MILIGSYPPIINSAARLYSELAESLKDMGHHVTVITAHPGEEHMVDEESEYYCAKPSSKYLKGVHVFRVSPLSLLAKFPGGKPLRFFISCLLYTIRGLCARRPDVVLVYSPPIYMGIAGYIISKAKQTRFVFNMQDIHPKVLFDSGIIKNKFIKSILSVMEEICYRKAYSFIVYSDGNRDHLLQRGVDREVFIIANWVDTTVVKSSDRMISFRKEERIGDKFVVSYAGTMLQAQGLALVVESAKALSGYNNIIFILAGEGSSKTNLQSLIKERRVNNVLLRSAMSRALYLQFLCASDVCVVALSPDTPLQTVPGKLADIMASGRPVIAAVNQQGDAARIIKQAECGFCVDPGDVDAFSRAVLSLHRDECLRKTMGEKGRIFAEQHFSRAVCTKQYEKVLFSAMRGNRLHS